MQVLAKITINKNVFNKVMSFWLRFVTERNFDCEQVKQQTSQTTFQNHAFKVDFHSKTSICRHELGGGGSTPIHPAIPTLGQTPFSDKTGQNPQDINPQGHTPPMPLNNSMHS